MMMVNVFGSKMNRDAGAKYGQNRRIRNMMNFVQVINSNFAQFVLKVS